MAQFIHPLLYNCPCQLSLSLSLHISNFCSSLNNKNQLISYPLHTHTRVDSSLLYNSFPFLPTNDQPGSYPQWQFYCIKKSYIKYYGHSTSTYKSIINSIIVVFCEGGEEVALISPYQLRISSVGVPLTCFHH